MWTSLTKRIGRLEGAMMRMQRIQDDDRKFADLSMLSMEEREIVEKALDYTLVREATAPTGKRPLGANPAALSADDMVAYRRMGGACGAPMTASISQSKPD
jgi:hypothetical protein